MQDYLLGMSEATCLRMDIKADHKYSRFNYYATLLLQAIADSSD